MSTTTRSSSRIADKLKAEVATRVPSATSSTPVAPPKKRQKTTTPANSKPKVKAAPTKRVRGKRGELKMMHEMPLDIVLEIMTHLEPIDLLHISRVSKGLRALTQGPGAQLMWKKVYENMGDRAPPTDLPGLNLQTLTAALWGKDCQICGKRKGQVTLYAFRIRLCWECAPTCLVAYHKDHPPVYKLCPTTWLKRPSVKLYPQAYWFKGEINFHLRKSEQTKSLPPNERHETLWKSTEWARKQYHLRLITWHFREKRRSMQEGRDIVAKRQEAITARVIAAGYGAELNLVRIHRLPGMRVRAELTDKSWDRIKGRILSALEYLRQERLERDMSICFVQRIRNFQHMIAAAFKDVPQPRIAAPLYELMNSDAFHDILRSYTGAGTQPFSDEMRGQINVLGLAGRVLKITDTWKDASDKHLLDLVISARPKSKKSQAARQPVDHSPLELATTFFTCHWCPEALTYPRVLVHSCFRDQRKKDKASHHSTDDDTQAKDDDDDDEAAEEEDDDASAQDLSPENNWGIPQASPSDVWNKLYIENGRRWNESGDEITFDKEASESARSIIQATGEDPDTITAAQVKAMDIRIECLRCAPDSARNVSRTRRSRLFLTWNMAILHDMHEHSEQPRSAQNWRFVVDEEELATIKAHEQLDTKRSMAKQYQCNICLLAVPEHKIKPHYKFSHSSHPFDEKKPLDYVFEHLDGPMKSWPLPVRL